MSLNLRSRNRPKLDLLATMLTIENTAGDNHAPSHLWPTVIRLNLGDAQLRACLQRVCNIVMVLRCERPQPKVKRLSRPIDIPNGIISDVSLVVRNVGD